MSIIVWIVIGGLAGWVAGMIMKTDGSLVKNIVTGIVGGFIGLKVLGKHFKRAGIA